MKKKKNDVVRKKGVSKKKKEKDEENKKNENANSLGPILASALGLSSVNHDIVFTRLSVTINSKKLAQNQS